MLENIDHSSSKKILDIGCCESLLPEELGERGHRVFGIEETMVDAEISNFLRLILLKEIVCLLTIEHLII